MMTATTLSVVLTCLLLPSTFSFLPNNHYFTTPTTLQKVSTKPTTRWSSSPAFLSSRIQLQQSQPPQVIQQPRQRQRRFSSRFLLHARPVNATDIYYSTSAAESSSSVTTPTLTIPKQQQRLTVFRKQSSTSTEATSIRSRRTLKRQQQQRSTATTKKQTKQWNIYCDLDGVLVDFEYGIRRLFPDYDALVSQSNNDGDSTTAAAAALSQNARARFDIQALPRHTMWERVANDGAFFRDLPWTPEGQFLWHRVLKHLDADILTGVPGYDASRNEKFDWCQRELGVHVRHLDVSKQYVHLVEPDVALKNVVRQVRGAGAAAATQDVPIHNVITCYSDQKFYASGPNSILIDDREALRPAWEARGGIFIHHVNLEYTLEQLSWYGIWNPQDEDTTTQSEEEADPSSIYFP